MSHIFTYGSLMFPEVWRKVTSGSYKAIQANTPNLCRKKIIGDTYPVAFQSITKTPLQGILYLDVSKPDVVKLDYFEGQYYQRSSITVYDNKNTPINAEIYLLRNRYKSLASSQNWCPEEFEQTTIKRFMRSYVGKRT